MLIALHYYVSVFSPTNSTHHRVLNFLMANSLGFLKEVAEPEQKGSGWAVEQVLNVGTSIAQISLCNLYLVSVYYDGFVGNQIPQEWCVVHGHLIHCDGRIHG